jgi:hypothetical protein
VLGGPNLVFPKLRPALLPQRIVHRKPCQGNTACRGRGNDQRKRLRSVEFAQPRQGLVRSRGRRLNVASGCASRPERETPRVPCCMYFDFPAP